MTLDLDISPEQAQAYLWSIGKLEWKLKPHQSQLYDAFHKAKQRTTVFHCSRRIGKSYTLCLIADEVARSKERAQIRYAAPTQKNVREIILPVMQEILSDCPRKYRPQWRGQDSHFLYPNGSILSIAGTDGGNADRLRGSACDLGILDEAGFIDNLRYVVRSILMPQFITTDGRLIISSSSPLSPAHDFVNYLERAEASGSLARMTIYEDSRPEVIARIPEWQAESGGKDSTDWLREYECKIIVDQTLAIVPEFTDGDRYRRLVKEVERPPFFDSYVSMDVGFNDLTAAIFGYWDFANAALVIEDELSLNRMTTEHLAAGIKAKEKAHFPKPPLVRVSDTDLIVIHDLNELHNLGFIPTAKDDKEAAVNLLRLLVAKEKLWIHPRCTGLISHLKYGVWNKARSQFDRAEGYGHFDFVDALVYLVRNLRREKNPYPHNLGLSDFTHFIPEALRNPPEASSLRQAFGLK